MSAVLSVLVGWSWPSIGLSATGITAVGLVLRGWLIPRPLWKIWQKAQELRDEQLRQEAADWKAAYFTEREARLLASNQVTKFLELTRMIEQTTQQAIEARPPKGSE